MTENLLLLFARFPRTGRVKTRLIPPLDAEGACRLYRAFLCDLVDRLKSSPSYSLRVMVAGEDGDVQRMGSLLGSDSSGGHVAGVSAQEGENLGERLSAAFKNAFGQLWRRVIVLGADHPSIPVEYLERGFELLLTEDIIAGPSEDGGFYSLGMTEPRGELIEGLPWSRPDLFDMLTGRIEQAGGIRFSELPLWYDIDRPADLIRLAGSDEELRELPRTSRYLADPAVRALLNMYEPEKR